MLMKPDNAMLSVLTVSEIRFGTKNINILTTYVNEFSQTFTKVIMIVITFRCRESYAITKMTAVPILTCYRREVHYNYDVCTVPYIQAN
jgi:arabinogalactan endo-1,4-beta-galactosidase